MHLKMRQQHS